MISYERVQQKLVFVPQAVYSYGSGELLLMNELWLIIRLLFVIASASVVASLTTPSATLLLLIFAV
jgi:hypothetical protein